MNNNNSLVRFGSLFGFLLWCLRRELLSEEKKKKWEEMKEKMGEKMSDLNATKVDKS